MTQHNAEVTTIALSYAERGWPVFPCKPWPDKAPLTERGFHDASTARAVIEAWWQHLRALIAVATGEAGLAILDVDVKDPKKYGPDSLELLGHPIPDTWIVHTPSGGWHYWFDPADLDIPSTTNKISSGLDVRARGGYIIAPTPGSGYRWDDHCNPWTLPLAPAPAWLIPPLPKPETFHRVKPVKPCTGLSPYADAAIQMAVDAIRDAPNGQQRNTLTRECFSIGTLAGAGGIPEAFARAALFEAAQGMPNFDPRRLWTGKELRRTVTDCFDAGQRHPRATTTRRAS